MTIELRIIQTMNKSEAKNLQKILDSADASQAKNLSAILHSFENRKENTQSVGQYSPEEQKSAVHVEKDDAKSRENTPKVRDNKTEILNQDRGR